MKRRSFLFAILALIGIRPKAPTLYVMKGRACGPSCAPPEVYFVMNGELRKLTINEQLALAS